MHQRNKDAADRIRPFLRAMERSIEEARSDRTDTPAPQHQTAPTSATDETTFPTRLNPDAGDTAQEFDPRRLKARPKRRLAS